MNKIIQGFTLIELLVVMAILGVAYFVVIPNFSNTLKNQQSIIHIQSLVKKLESKKNKSIQSGATQCLVLKTESLEKNRVEVCFYPDGRSSGVDSKIIYKDFEYMLSISRESAAVEVRLVE